MLVSLLFNASYLAWSDTKARYKKSILGPFWLTLTNLIGILGLSVVWGTLLKEEMSTFVPSLTIGMIVWQLVAGTIGDAPTTFVRQAGVIRNVAMPIWFFVVRGLTKQVINFLHNIIIIVGVVIYFHFPLTNTMLLSIVGLLLVILNLFWITFLLGFVGARFRDIEWAITALLPLLFFVSPVIFKPDHLPEGLDIIWFNPLSYFIEVVRAPFLGKIPDMHTYIVMLSFLVLGGVLSLWLAIKKGKRVAYWV